MKQFALIILLLLLNRYSQSLLCYDCFDMEPSNEKCVKSKNCTGEACLLYEGEDMFLTTAFCLLNLPKHYRKQNEINDAKCWMENDGRGKHCICSQNFCNQLRDRRIPLQGNLPLINASLIDYNPLIDYDYASENEPNFTFDLLHLDDHDHANVVVDDTLSKDLIPLEIGNSDYKDMLKLSLQESIKSTLSPSLSSSSPLSISDNEYQQLSTTIYTATKHISNQNIQNFYETNEEITKKQLDDTFIIHPDQIRQEITENMIPPTNTSNNFRKNPIYFIIIFLFKLFFISFL